MAAHLPPRRTCASPRQEVGGWAYEGGRIGLRGLWMEGGLIVIGKWVD